MLKHLSLAEREPERNVLGVREHRKRSEGAPAGRAAGLETPPDPLVAIWTMPLPPA